MKENRYNGTGTLQENRIPKDCLIASKKEVLKWATGSSVGSLETNERIMIAKMMNNAAVIVASTAYGS